MQKANENNIPSKTLPGRRSRRILWLAIILASMAVYFPINRLSHGGVQLSLPLDGYIPLYSPFIIPYLLGTLSFIGLPVWAALKVRAGDFEEYVIAILLATWISYLVYILFPTYVVRPDIMSQDIFSKAMNILYQSDQVHNAAPSGHAFYSTLALLYLMRWKRGARARAYWLVWMAFWIVILASTLFTRQHNLLDLAAGIALAVMAYKIAGYIRRKWALKFAS